MRLFTSLLLVSTASLAPADGRGPAKNERKKGGKSGPVGMLDADTLCTAFDQVGSSCSDYPLASLCRVESDDGTYGCLQSTGEVRQSCHGMLNETDADTACHRKCNNVLKSCCMNAVDLDCSIESQFYEFERMKDEQRAQKKQLDQEKKEQKRLQGRSRIVSNADAMCTAFSRVGDQCSAYPLDILCKLEDSGSPSACLSTKKDVRSSCQTIAAGTAGLNANDTAACTDACEGIIQTCCMGVNENLNCSAASQLMWEDSYKKKSMTFNSIKGGKRKKENDGKSKVLTTSDAICTNFAHLGDKCEDYPLASLCRADSVPGTAAVCMGSNDEVRSTCSSILSGTKGLNNSDSTACADQCPAVLQSCCLGIADSVDCSTATALIWERKFNKKALDVHPKEDRAKPKLQKDEKSLRVDRSFSTESKVHTYSDAMCKRFEVIGPKCSAYPMDSICGVQNDDGTFQCLEDENSLLSTCETMLAGAKGLNSTDAQVCASNCKTILQSCCLSSSQQEMDCSLSFPIQWNKKMKEVKGAKQKKIRKERVSRIKTKADAMCVKLMHSADDCSSYPLASTCKIERADGTFGCINNEEDARSTCELITEGVYGLNSTDTAACANQCQDIVQSCCASSSRREEMDCSTADFVKWRERNNQKRVKQARTVNKVIRAHKAKTDSSDSSLDG